MVISTVARRGLWLVAAMAASAAWHANWCWAGDADAQAPPTNRFVCRLANYGKFQDAALNHLPKAGFKYIFTNVPPADQVEALRQRLADHGLRAAVLRGQTNFAQPDCVAQLAVQLATCEKLGVRYMFLSVKHPGVGKQIVYERLRQAGEIAKRRGVVIALETHPDMGTNGDVQLETMRQVDHPNVRVNFDTGNITFYNKGTTAVAELRKIIDFVATVELKDHDGQYKTWTFPPLGQGKVDFPEVLRILREHHYTGPLTLEVEGIEGVSWDERQTKKAIAESAAYIRSLGTFD
jgi:inosose dehydratase